MRITSVNVNGIRAAMRKGMGEWITQRQPDVILMQETRAEPEIVAALLPEWQVVTAASRIKGRAGVAAATRVEPLAVRHGLPGESADVDSGRWLEVDLPSAGDGGAPLTLVTAYLHSGTAGTPTMDLKYAHLDLVEARLRALAGDVMAARREVLVVGDFNVVRGPADIKNFKGNHNRTAGVLDQEMAYLDRWFTGAWRDVHRELVPAAEDGTPGPYTWWSNRGKAFDNDAGWRIDYHMASPRLAGVASGAVVDRAPSWDTRWSDHAPLTVDYDLAALSAL
ncbi:MAG TPA: exodeoxyribonuclease III [Actinomycetales bacterium]|nr:exodeoxyribonuclease III [Actinomycetales bacterium]